jgi:hypothetical protein
MRFPILSLFLFSFFVQDSNGSFFMLGNLLRTRKQANTTQQTNQTLNVTKNPTNKTRVVRDEL